MITTLIFTILLTLMNVIFGILNILLPTIPLDKMDQIYNYINKFFEIIKCGLAGFKFIAGPIPFILGGTILLMYTFYYTIFLPIRFIIRVFFKGN